LPSALLNIILNVEGRRSDGLLPRALLKNILNIEGRRWNDLLKVRC
jgi:hypothetical protein